MIPFHHQQSKTVVVVCGDEPFNIFQVVQKLRWNGFDTGDGELVVADENVKSEESDQTEVPEVFVHQVVAEFGDLFVLVVFTGVQGGFAKVSRKCSKMAKNG